MAIVNEKVTYCKENGIIHVFRREEYNFLYIKPLNKAFQIADNVFLDLKINSIIKGIESLEISNIFNVIRQTKKHQYHFKSIYVKDFSCLDSIHTQLPRYSVEFFQTELIFHGTHSLNVAYRTASLISGYPNNELLSIIEVDDVTGIKHMLSEHSGLKYLINLDFDTFNETASLFDGKHCVIKLLYHQDKETDIANLVESSNFNVFLKCGADADHSQFLAFLKLQLPDLKKSLLGTESKLFNVTSLHKYLSAGFTNIREIDSGQNGSCETIKSEACSKCWAHHICWFLKCFDSFNIDLENIEAHYDKCNLVRAFIEDGIHSLYKMELLNQFEKNNNTNVLENSK